MESDFDPRQALAASDRAAASSWIDFPRTPGWYAPAGGAWAAAFAATRTVLDGWVAALVGAVLVGLLLVFIRWYRRYRGTMPLLQAAPPEMRGVMRGFLLGAVLVVGSAISWLPWPVSLVLTFVVVTGALALYESRYAAAAAAARTRLG